MLSIYGSFTVPGVPDAVIYRDDEDPKKFYMLAGQPRILRSDPRVPTSQPMLDFIAYVRDLDLHGTDGDTERALLQMTVGLEISPADQQTIRTHLRAKIADEAASGYRFLGVPVRLAEPELSYPPLMIEGLALATSFGPDLAVAQQISSPALGNGVNAASFSWELGQSGARVLRQALDQGALPVQVRYDGLKIVGRIPAVTIRIHGERSDVVREVRQHAVQRNFQFAGGLIVQKLVWYPPPGLQTIRETIQSLTVEIDDSDFRDADPADNLSEELEKMALAVLENTIMPSLFEPAIPAEEETDDDAGNGWWLPNETSTVTGRIDLTMTRRDTVQVEHGANGLVASHLTVAEAKAAVRVADANLANVPVEKLTVIANVNFLVDPILVVRVLIDYDQVDDRMGRRVRTQEQISFQQGDGPIVFKFPMATDRDGAAKTDYRYQTVVNFKGSDRVVEFPPAGGWITTRGGYLVISYAQLGQVKVDLLLAAMPPDIASVDVTLGYPDTTLPGAVQTISLSAQTPTASYLVTTNGTDPIRPYSVMRRFRLTDGSTIDIPAEQSSTAIYTVTSPFELTSVTTFVGRGSFGTEIAEILVTPVYEDPTHALVDRATIRITPTARSAEWRVRQVDKDLRAFTYAVRILRVDGSDSHQTATGLLGDVITVGDTGAGALEVLVDAEQVDWMKFTRVLVTLSYDDPANGISLRKPLMFSDSGVKMQTWAPLIADSARRSFRYAVRRLGRVAGDDVTEPEVTTDDSFVILR